MLIAWGTFFNKSIGNISALLAICAGNSPVTGEFPTQRPVTRSFDVFVDLRLNKRLSNNREAGYLSRYRAHYDAIVMIMPFISGDELCQTLQIHLCKSVSTFMELLDRAGAMSR